METSNGVIINQACQILIRTYKELNRLKDDISEMLFEYDQSMQFVEEYSYGPKTLYLKPHHTYLYKMKTDEPENGRDRFDERVLAIICIFYDADIPRLNLKDEPEIWFALFEITNTKQKYRSWDFYNLLKISEREAFATRDLRTDGNIVDYYWADNDAQIDEKEEWKGKVLGYPLVEISDIDTLKIKVFQKLFE